MIAYNFLPNTTHKMGKWKPSTQTWSWPFARFYGFYLWNHFHSATHLNNVYVILRHSVCVLRSFALTGKSAPHTACVPVNWRGSTDASSKISTEYCQHFGRQRHWKKRLPFNMVIYLEVHLHMDILRVIALYFYLFFDVLSEWKTCGNKDGDLTTNNKTDIIYIYKWMFSPSWDHILCAIDFISFSGTSALYH